MSKVFITEDILQQTADAIREASSSNAQIKPEDFPEKIKELPYWYGVRKDCEVINAALTRIGSPVLHRTLPIQSKIRRCLLLDDGTVNYYLDANDSTLKEDGTPAVLDGTDGQVMVEIPEHYLKIEKYVDQANNHPIQEAKISEYPLPGFTKVEKCYISAFEASLDRTNSKLASVVNTTAQYRGGDNTNWDGTYRSLLGMPATSISLTNFRTYAKNRGMGWVDNDTITYDIMCYLYLIEYANTNCQLAFNVNPDANGYKQGGLGVGVSNMNGWNNYNSYNPIIPCGVTLSLGNATGVVTHNVIASDGSTTHYAASVPSYRGIENPFGHIWKFVDGILINIAEEGTSDVYRCTDPTKYSSSLTADYVKIGEEARTSGWTKNVIFPTLIASEVGGVDSSTGYCDYHYTSLPESGNSVRAFRVGGTANTGSDDGQSAAYSNATPSRSYSDVGSRLCFHPTE